MKYVSTRKGIEATAPETVFQGLAPDGGLYVPVVGASLRDARGRLGEASLPGAESLPAAEKFVLDALFGDFPAEVRKAAIDRLLSRFPAEDPVPLVEKDGLHMLELFHGKTGAFKDVALSMLPVFMRHAAGGRRVLVLTATSGDTGSAAMQGFAGVDGTLQKRMVGTEAAGNVRAKTGTVTGISSLAGYLTTATNHVLAFAIINQGVGSSSIGRAFQDKVCQELCK